MKDWVVCLTEYQKLYDSPIENVANFDETNVFWTPDAKTTLNRARERTITCNGAKTSNRVTAMIGVSAAGH